MGNMRTSGIALKNGVLCSTLKVQFSLYAATQSGSAFEPPCFSANAKIVDRLPIHLWVLRDMALQTEESFGFFSSSYRGVSRRAEADFGYLAI